MHTLTTAHYETLIRCRRRTVNAERYRSFQYPRPSNNEPIHRIYRNSSLNKQCDFKEKHSPGSNIRNEIEMFVMWWRSPTDDTVIIIIFIFIIFLESYSLEGRNV